jgi:hypothetical protein
MNPVSVKDLVPLAISGLAAVANPAIQTFKYNDVEQNNIQLINKDSLTHLISAQDINYGNIIHRFRFYQSYEKWIKEVRFLSSPNQIVEDQNFKQIVEMGLSSVLFIMEEIEREPSYLVWALNHIYGFKISDNSLTTIPEACKAWLKYLKSAQIAFP